MPLYVYTCPDCDIEVEELRPAWRVDEPVECPICHELCSRAVSTFYARSRNPTAPIYASPQQTARALHGAGCSCCVPRRR